MALTGKPWDLGEDGQVVILLSDCWYISYLLPRDRFPVHLVGQDDISGRINGFVKGKGAAVLIANLRQEIVDYLSEGTFTSSWS